MSRPLTGPVPSFSALARRSSCRPTSTSPCPRQSSRRIRRSCGRTRCPDPRTGRWRRSPSLWPGVSSTCCMHEASSPRSRRQMEHWTSSSSKASVPRSGPRPPARSPGRRCALRRGLLPPCRHLAPRERRPGPRAAVQLRRPWALSLERLSALPDGRLAYRMKRPSATGQTHLVFPPVALLRRLAALVPPPRANLVRDFGVFAPNARVRPRVVPAPAAAGGALSPSARSGPAAPSPGPNSSSGRSRRTSSPARAAEATAASSPSSFALPPPRPPPRAAEEKEPTPPQGVVQGR